MKKKKDSKGRVLKTGENQRSNGSYQYRYKDIFGNYQYVYAKDLVTLREKEEHIFRDRLDGISYKSGKISLNQLFDDLMNRKKNLRDSTRKNYYSMWDNNIRESAIGDMGVAEIRPNMIEGLFAKCHDDGLKKNTIKYLYMMMMQVFEDAVDNDYIRKNPCVGTMRNISNDATEKIPLTQTNIDNLIEFCRGDNTYCLHIPFLVIAIGSCMRCGELTGLTWDDVDMTNKIINVNHQLIYKNYGDGCRFYIAKPKTESGVRQIPMTNSVYKAFIEIKKLYMILGRRCNSTVDGYSNFVFVSKNGEPYAPNGINSFLLNLEKKYNAKNPNNMIPHLSAHILRHTGCTLYADKGLDIKALQSIMGHADAGVTMNVYNHASVERTTKALKNIECVKIG
jgi:integrase